MQSKISSIQSIEEDYFFLYNPASTDTASEFSIYLLCLLNNRNMKIQKNVEQQKSARFSLIQNLGTEECDNTKHLRFTGG